MLLLILLGAAAVLAVLSIPVYFAALRPRRGTTEWMRCIETPHFLPLRICRPHLSDLGWLPLAVVLGVGLRLLLQLLRTAATASTAGAVLADLPGYALHVLLPCAALAAGMYLLIRLTVGGVLASICGAAAISVLQGGSLSTAAAIAWALLFLWLWVCAADTEHTALSALWLTLSLVCFAAGLYLYVQLLWLTPLWVAAWVYVQCRRRSVGRAIASLLLTALLCAVLGTVLCVLWLLHGQYTGRGWTVCFTTDFLQALPTVAAERLRLLASLPDLAGTVRYADGLLVLAGGAAMVCALHGAIRRRESLCLVLLVLLCFAALPLLGGQYLLTLPLTLALGWLWSLWSRRRMTVFVLLSIGILLMTDCIISLLQQGDRL